MIVDKYRYKEKNYNIRVVIQYSIAYRRDYTGNLKAWGLVSVFCDAGQVTLLGVTFFTCKGDCGLNTLPNLLFYDSVQINTNLGSL